LLPNTEAIAFDERHNKREMPYFGQDQMVKALALGPLTSEEYREALARCRRLTRTEGIDAVMDRSRLDALVAPTLGPACLTDLVTGDRWLGAGAAVPAVAEETGRKKRGHPGFFFAKKNPGLSLLPSRESAVASSWTLAGLKLRQPQLFPEIDVVLESLLHGGSTVHAAGHVHEVVAFTPGFRVCARHGREYGFRRSHQANGQHVAGVR
jgi:hypothetical protein